MPHWQEAYPEVHRALAPEYRGLSEDQVEAVLRGVFGEDITLADAEGFFNDIGRGLANAAKAAAPVLQRALPGVVSGAMSGAALGPWGMLGGALLGGVGSAIGGGGGGAGAPRAGIPGAPPTRLPVPIPGRGPAGPGAAGPAGAVGQLLGVLGSPTVQQALSSMMLGQAGARTVPGAGGGQLPVAAITNLLGMLATRASAEWEEVMPSAEGEMVGEGLDLATPEVLAEWTLAQLVPPALGESFDESSDEAWLDEAYDALEVELLAEAMDEGYDEAYDPEAWSLPSHG